MEQRIHFRYQMRVASIMYDENKIVPVIFTLMCIGEIHTRYLGFIIDETGATNMCLNKPEGETLFSHIGNTIDEHRQDLEDEYGCHDFCGILDEKIVYGYESAEVDDSQVDELMKAWHNVFVNLAGKDNVSAIVDMGTIDVEAERDDSSQTLYDRITEAL